MENDMKTFADKANAVNELAGMCHAEARRNGWHNSGKLDFPRSVALMHSELSEALEGDRKDLQDEHLPHRKMVEVELADLIIRCFDTAASMGLDLGGAFVEKLQYNRDREDHKAENRAKAGGKKY